MQQEVQLTCDKGVWLSGQPRVFGCQGDVGGCSWHGVAMRIDGVRERKRASMKWDICGTQCEFH